MRLRNEISRRVAQFQHLWIGRPKHVIFFGQGIGDDLLCSTVAHELKKRGAGRIVMFSRYPSLFEHNPDVAAVYHYGYPTVGRMWRWGYGCVVPQFSVYDEQRDRDVFPNEHLLATMCRIAGITGTIELRPYMTLLASEKAAGKLLDNQVAIQSGGLGQMKNKDWLPERYQAVSDQLAHRFGVVHLGQKTDPPIQGALDLRGKTTLRESAAILASSRVFVGQVGFLMHLARAVDCRSVIVYGGREEPLVSGYRVNENMVGRTICSPCWQRNKCDYGRECMRIIEPDAVVVAVRRQLDREGTPLEVEQVNLDLTRSAPDATSLH
jgi:hypothetical protein